MDALIDTLSDIVGHANVLSSPTDTAAFYTDWRGRYTGQGRCVVRPGCTDEVAAVVHACAHAGVAMIPQGGNTGLVGGATPRAGGREVVISTTRLNHIREVDLANGTVTVEAGCTLAAIQQVALEHQRLFPLSLASQGSCQIGGNLATNAGGVHVLRYGNMRELTLGLEVVLPDGQIWQGLRGLRKDNTGYDLKHLFIGAEGTLGIITAAVLKLFPLPTTRIVCWLAFDSAEQAVQALMHFKAAAGERVSAFELIGREAVNLVLKHIPAARDPLPDAHPWYALIEFSDVADNGLRPRCEAWICEAMDAGAVNDGVMAESEAQATALWRLREDISEAQKREGFSIKHDIAIPISCIADFLFAADGALQAHFSDVRIVAFGHAGDGNLHYNVSKRTPSDNASFLDRSEDVNRIVHDLVHQMRGSISAEHGLGQLKRHEITRYKSTVELDLMRSIKTALDPRGLMNPGKLL